MKFRRTVQNMKTIAVMVLFLIASTAGTLFGQRYVERLNRGLVAVKSGTGNFLSWRLFGTEQGSDIAFNVYKGSTRLNTSPIGNATCWQDNSSGIGDYSVRAVVGGQEQPASPAEHVLSGTYLAVPLQNASGYRAGDASCGDLDADGRYEIVLKEENSPQDNSISGVTGQTKLTAYKLSGARLWRIDLGINIREGAHYTQFMVYDLDGDGSAEVACKTAPGTRDGTGAFLKLGPAAADNDAADYRNSSGYILSGPEYLTVFSGRTGAELATVEYKPLRGSVGSWGDTYGNRVDRFLACVAYLDGSRPSLVMCRGYYTRTTLWALDWRGGKLIERWFFDSNISGNSRYAGQGNHNLSVGDLDGDGFDEIEYGACTIDHDGKGLYSTGLGHGDAGHLGDLDPDRLGLEYFQCHEGGAGITFRDAKTGQVIWQKGQGGGDIGRGCSDNIAAGRKGAICWGAGVGAFDCKGTTVSSIPSSCNFLCWWDGDLARELLNSNAISKYGGGTLLSASGCSSINGTKSTPCLSADLLGDWREEVVFSCGNELRIYTTTTPTAYRLYTLMHDPHYRVSIAWQNVAYNQPPHTGFYLGDGMTLPQARPNIRYYDGSAVSQSGSEGPALARMAHPGLFVMLNHRKSLPNTRTETGGEQSYVLYSLDGKIMRKTGAPFQLPGGSSPKLYIVKITAGVPR